MRKGGRKRKRKHENMKRKEGKKRLKSRDKQKKL